jgi:hypothetical protein
MPTGVAFGSVELDRAHLAGDDLREDLPKPGPRYRHVFEARRRTDVMEHSALVLRADAPSPSPRAVAFVPEPASHMPR